MLTRLTLENFMAHRRTELPLGPGVTVLRGPNNSGKSAVVEALRCLAANPPVARAFIRHGAKEARVTAELAGGERLTWIRRPASAGYRIERPGAEPEEFWKLGKSGVPDEVRDLLRLDEVALEGRKEAMDVHLGNQRDPVFLLDETPAAIASFFASSTEAAHLLAMQQALAGRVRTSRITEKNTLSRLDAIFAELDALAELPAMELAAERLEAGREAARAAAELVPRLEADIAELGRTRAQRARLGARLDTARTLAAPPALAPVAPLARTIVECSALKTQREAATARHAALSLLAPLPDLAPVAPLARTLAERFGLARQADALAARREALASLSSPPAPEDVAPLADLAARRKALAAAAEALERKQSALNGLAEPPSPFDPAPAASLCREMSRLAREQSRLDAQKSRCEAELASLAGRIAELLERAGACPLCGSKVTAEAFLSGGHGHG